MAAIQLTIQESLVIAAVEAKMEDAFASGAEYPAATNVVKALENWAMVSDVSGVDKTKDAKAAFLGAMVSSMKATPSWTAPTLLNSYTNHGGATSPAGFHKDITGTVYLRGAVQSGSSNSTIFVLPAGCIPEYNKILLCPAYVHNPNTFVSVRVDVHGPGEAIPGSVFVHADSPLGSTGVYDWLSLDGISFKAA